jgi:hypothetical protein
MGRRRHGSPAPGRVIVAVVAGRAAGVVVVRAVRAAIAVKPQRIAAGIGVATIVRVVVLGGCVRGIVLILRAHARRSGIADACDAQGAKDKPKSGTHGDPTPRPASEDPDRLRNADGIPVLQQQVLAPFLAHACRVARGRARIRRCRSCLSCCLAAAGRSRPFPLRLVDATGAIAGRAGYR